MLAYMENGPDGVRALRDSRMTLTDQWINHSFHSYGRLKASVENWLREITKSFENANYPLVSQLAQQMLQSDPNRRPNAKVVQRILSCLHGKFLLDSSLQL